ncbi:MAG: type II toxin-antitoxin system RelE/ParE family toxin [Candidatus Marinimicrobia bacterium]|nr:type II toxin-antitoxin system RelE/ParE family toxin [Candidatus Neomarinimicrobiota bacterium]
MARVVWTEPTIQDLDALADYISLDNPTAAQKFVRKIFSRVEKLEQRSQSGKSVPELAPSPYRELVIAPCRLFYRATGDYVYVLHVMRAEQLFRAELLKSR